MNCVAVIVAGGTGKRFGDATPKQFLELSGKPVIVRSIEAFANNENVSSIIVAVHSEWYNHAKKLIEDFKLSKVKDIVVGGITRQDSVAAAIRTETAKNADFILVHDAVRPLVTNDLINRIIEETEEYGAVVPGVMINDTLKEQNFKGMAIKTLEREKVRAIQTPQGFWSDTLISAFESAKNSNFQGTDDASVVEFFGYKIKIVDGEVNNIKITDPKDIKLAEYLLS
ncbi:MAG: 2-C-methyl-D-erythritol 4-phosphate cytidylyltransferase [Candidatus Kapabacteria bacterium]|nr:2-C-methyl-D-erythritol 4-phosphate cytidylyltransferase [Candidatus Kapabacteria bacterium]